MRLTQCIALCLVLAAPAFSESTILIASGEWAPYQSDRLQHGGFASRIVSEAFESSGFDVIFKYMPWKRALEITKSGAAGATFLWGGSEEREADFYFSDPVLNVKYVFFSLRSDSFEWRTTDDLKGLAIGTVAGYTYGEEFDAAKSQGLFETQEVTEEIQNFTKLLRGRVDLVPNDLDAGLELIRESFEPKDIQRITYHELPLLETPHYLLVSKKHPKAREILRAFNEGFAKLRESGKLQEYTDESRRGEYKK